MIRKLFNWVFRSEIEKLKSEITNAKTITDRLTSELTRAKVITSKLEEQQKTFSEILSDVDVSVDVHEYSFKYSPSWAVISIQGKTSDYIKFIDLGHSDIVEIQRFLRQFERNSTIKVDASPAASKFLRVSHDKKF